MFVVYVIENPDSRIYIGQTNDLERRIAQHNDPLKKSWASKRGPWKVVFTKNFSSRSEAMRCERYLKSLKNKGKLLELVKYIAGWRKSTSTGS